MLWATFLAHGFNRHGELGDVANPPGVCAVSQANSGSVQRGSPGPAEIRKERGQTGTTVYKDDCC